MANNFQNYTDFGGVDLRGLPDNINKRNASDCNGIDFSLGGAISTAGGPIQRGQSYDSIIGYSYGDSFTFHKAFGTKKSIILRTIRGESGAMELQWFNEDLNLSTNAGRWENLYYYGIINSGTSFVNFNGDNGDAINRLIIAQSGGVPMIWNGAVAKVINWGDNQIVTNVSNLVTEGFEQYATNEIIINGKLYNYTGISGSTFTGVTPDPVTTPPTLNDGIAQHVNDTLCYPNLVNRTDISFSGNVITSAGYTFDPSTWVPGMIIKITGANNAANNGIFKVTAISGGTLTIGGYTFVTELAGPSIQIETGVPSGGIVATAGNKLYISGVRGNETKVYYSVTGYATCFAISTGLASGGSFNLIEGGGSVTSITPKSGSKIIVHKENNVILYTRDYDTSFNVVEKFDILESGIGCGAVNSNSVTSNGKTIYYLNSSGDIKSIESTIYSENTVDIKSIAPQVKDILKNGISNSYLCYDNNNNRFIISFYKTVAQGLQCSLLYLYPKQTADGVIYDCSFDEIVTPTGYSNQQISMTQVTGTSVSNGVMITLPLQRKSYLLGYGLVNENVQKKPYYVSGEYIFDGIAQDKQFNKLILDGYIYGTTKLRIRVVYGINGRDGVKNYIIDRLHPCVEKTVVGDFDDNYNGENCSLNSYRNNLVYTYYFKLPLHIDVINSDRYKIILETYGAIDQTRWIVNNLSVNTSLKDVDMNDLVNQNEVYETTFTTDNNYGIGTDIVPTNNTIE